MESRILSNLDPSKVRSLRQRYIGGSVWVDLAGEGPETAIMAPLKWIVSMFLIRQKRFIYHLLVFLISKP